MFDISLQKRDPTNPHRSGWNYIYDNIQSFKIQDMTSTLTSKKTIYLDLNVDGTFHWNHNNTCNLPYKRKWVGFIHHTFDTSFSDYNCTVLFNNELFIKSLDCCKGLIVLSKYLQRQLSNELAKRKLNIKVFYICHPTEMVVVKFSYNKFLDNKSKKMIHIGHWMRNIYSFYRLTLSPSYSFGRNIFSFGALKAPLEKAIINCKGNYHQSETFIKDIKNILCKENTGNCNQKHSISDGCKNGKNHWYEYFLLDINNMIKNVKVIDKLSNPHYDHLLSENIVFINLIDASAVNTLIECIVRNTPIIINKIDSVVELLGDDYPLYYNSNTNYFNINLQIENLLNKKNNIRDATKYLSRLDKNKFKIELFNDELNNIIKTLE